MKYNALTIFGDRLKRIGIDVVFAANYPWIYLEEINGKKVVEKHQSEHGFVVGYMSIRKDGGFMFEKLDAIFDLIRKYLPID